MNIDPLTTNTTPVRRGHPPSIGNDRDATSQQTVLPGPFGDGNRRD